MDAHLFFEWLYGVDVWVLYPAIVLLIVASGALGNGLGLWFRQHDLQTADIGILAGAALGLLALLLAFTFSIALARYDVRRDVVLEEANAIGSAANFALMLPTPSQGPILRLLQEYADIRVGLGVPFDPAKLERDIGASLDLQTALWRAGADLTAAAPQSLPIYRFVTALNDLNNVHEGRLSALRAHVPGEVMFTLIVVSMVAIGFAGYNTGVNGSRRRISTLLMAVTIVGLVIIIVDLDRPARGLIRVPVQSLEDAASGLPAPMGG